MHRHALEHLIVWARKPRRKPLVVRGARQVGKSYLVRALAQRQFANILEINMETAPDVAGLFQSKEPATIVPLLEARFGTTVTPGRTLLFLDEVQTTPSVLACLRYFYEKMPDLHVIAAGSLLDFALQEHDVSMPVGRIEYLHLGPMSFEEFLLAAGMDKLVQLMGGLGPGDQLAPAIHQELIRRTKQFLVVGGMPESVQAFVQSADLRESAAIRQGILSTYRDDFAKYSKRIRHRQLKKVLAKIPLMVGRKFVYAHVDRQERSRELGQALQMLCMARVAQQVPHSAGNGVPLGAESDDRSFKVLFLDVGLLVQSCGLSLLDVQQAEDIMLVNAGAVCEQFVGQHLLYAGEPYLEPAIHCWMRQKPNSSAEVDYLLALGNEVVPVEVKAGKTGTLKSLHLFLREKNRSFGLRFNADLPSLLDARTSLTGHNTPFRLLSLPLYMAGQASRLCREAMQS